MTMLDLYNLSREMARKAVIQNSETDGFAYCLHCSKETDPQVYDEQGSEHEDDCIVGQFWQLIGESDRGARARGFAEVK